jgi:hypothetical protein
MGEVIRSAAVNYKRLTGYETRFIAGKKQLFQR